MIGRLLLALLATLLGTSAVWDNVAKIFRKGSTADPDVASASRATGNSGTLDGQGIFAIDALITVTVAGTTLNVAIEESSDGTTWAAVSNVNQNAVGSTRLRALLTRRYYRYVWTITGANYTFKIDADKKGPF